MSAASTSTYGISYPPGLLETLPVVPSGDGAAASHAPPPPPPTSLTLALTKKRSPTSHPPTPIRLLPPQLFTSLHIQHLLAHPPDHVLFPFLHGLEGENDAQNTFFANASAGSHWVVGVEVPVAVRSASGDGVRVVARPPISIDTGVAKSTANSNPTSANANANAGTTTNTNTAAVPEHQMQIQHHQLLRPKVPRYRGLVWVVCEEDVKKGGDKVTLRILRRKANNAASSAGDDDSDAAAAAAKEAQRAVVGAMAGLGGATEMDVDVDGGSSDFDFDLDDDELSSSSCCSEDGDSSSSSFEDDEDDDDDDEDEDDEDDIYADDERERDVVDVNINLDDDNDNEPSIHPPPSSKIKTKEELSKDEMDRMPYMHPVVSPHRPPTHQQQPQAHPQLASINTTLPLPAPHSHSHSHSHSVRSTNSSESAASSLDSSSSGAGAEGGGAASATSTSTSAGSLGVVGGSGSGSGGVSTAPTSVASTSPVSASGPFSSSIVDKAGTGVEVEGGGGGGGGDREYPRVIQLEEGVAGGSEDVRELDEKELEGQRGAKGGRRKNKKGRKGAPAAAGLGVKNKDKKKDKQNKKKSRLQTDPNVPPLLTCTFRPKELLRRKRVTTSSGAPPPTPGAPTVGQQEVWEFVPARVPDGISLRNFGIQMPIYATMSDIVIYSPKGVTPACVALAERFREAIERKRRERVNAVKGVVYSQVHHGHGHGQQQLHYRHGESKNAEGAKEKEGQHFIRVEDVLRAEKENRARVRAEKASATAGGALSEASEAGVGTVQTPNTPATPAMPSVSSPTPSDSASEDDSIFDSSEDDDDEDDLETRMLDTAERYLMSLVEDDLLDYNVFILDADEEKMRSQEGGMGHLMVRLCGAGVPGGSSSASSSTSPTPVTTPTSVGAAGEKRGHHHGHHKKIGSVGRKKGMVKKTGNTTLTGAHTVGTDGETRSDAMNVDHHHLHHPHHHHQRDEDEGMVVGDMDIDTEPVAATSGDVEMEELTSSSSSRRRHSSRRHSQHSHSKDEDSEVEEEGREEGEADRFTTPFIPNTVDFALREKEEMRDLTKASEIISLFPRPTPVASPLSGSPVMALSPASSSSASPAPHQHHHHHHHHHPPPPGFGPQQPAHLNHLRGLIPTSPASSSSASSSSSRYRQQPPQQQSQPHTFQAQTPQQHPVQVEYAFTHPDPGVDISSPATFFDPRVGQVFLGNSGDVPLAQNGVGAASTPTKGTEKGKKGTKKTKRSKSKGAGGDSLVVRSVGERGEMHVRDVGVDPLVLGGGEGDHGEKGLEVPHVEFGMREPREVEVTSEDEEEDEEEEDEEEDDLPHDDPFNYRGTNDPKNGFGYDICLECHELAPFPTATHIRAAEEHLGVLEGMWRERCVTKEKARREKARGKERARKEAAVQSGDSNESQVEGEFGVDDEGEEDTTPILIPPRPPPHASAVIHLPFPSSPPNSNQTMAQLLPILRFLEKWIRPVPGEVKVEIEVKEKPKESSTTPTPSQGTGTSGVRRWSSSVASLMPSVFNMGGNNTNTNASPPPSSSSSRSRSFTAPAPTSHHRSNSGSSSSSASSGTPPHPTRPLKLLLYSADGYTESSLAALCLLMSVKGLTLPEAYLDLQVGKRRSFFVYQHDMGVVRRVETRLIDDRERERERERVMRERMEMERMVREAREREREARERMIREREQQQHQHQKTRSSGEEEQEELNANGKRTIGSVHNMSGNEGKSAGLSLFKVFGGSVAPSSSSSPPPIAASSSGPTRPSSAAGKPFTGRPAAKSVSFSQAPTWAGQRAGAPSSPSQSQQNRIPPTIPQGVVDTSVSGHIPLRPPEEHTGSLPQKSATLPAIPSSGVAPAVSSGNGATGAGRGSYTGAKRPRANTSPWLPSFFGGDHQSWFNDPRFDGSFPSRVLPFLYLGNLNHASNVYMLHALGITHVVSVGECALLPPPYHMIGHSSGGANPSSAACAPRHMSAQATKGHGSLWIEEREGRIKVLDIKGVCDDGIDTLEPQLEPICEWIDKAREEGGQVLVHCRVGVSRSATVTIAYVMKHLSLPLVDAYLIVRSRRLSVLIQPNMRLLYNLCGWEVKLAKERAGWIEDEGTGNNAVSSVRSLEDYVSGERKLQKRKEMEKKLERELARTLTWPYLAMEVHKLNEKYLH